MGKEAILGSPSSPYLKTLFNVGQQYFNRHPNERVCSIEEPGYEEYQIMNIEGKLYVVSEEHFLGEGGFGKVYVGQDENGKCFAIKKEKVEWSNVDSTNYDKKENEAAVSKWIGKAEGMDSYHTGNIMDNEGVESHEYEFLSALTLEAGEEMFLQIKRNIMSEGKMHQN